MARKSVIPDSPEEVLPYGESSSKSGEVEGMFDSIARRYDFMNCAMTFGLHRVWLTSALKSLRRICPEAGRILDVASGTGDVALRLRDFYPHAHITGIDLSAGMLSIARNKARKADVENMDFMQADCLALPFADNSFDIVTVAYGVRNFEKLLAGYREMYRVLRPGGTICVIELSRPSGKLTGAGYDFYSRGIIPAVGKLVSGDSRAYTYLPESIAACPQREDMCTLIREAGFKATSWRCRTFGVVTVYLGRK